MTLFGRLHKTGIMAFIVIIFLALNSSALPSLAQDFTNSVVVTYPVPNNAQPSSTYWVLLNGQSVYAEKYNSLSYIHFAFAGEVKIEVHLNEPVNSFTLSPKSNNIPAAVDGNKITFTLDRPRKLVLHKLNNIAEPLFILADPLEDDAPNPNAANVLNVLAYGADSTGNIEATEAIQHAINDAAQANKILYIPPGVYKIGELKLRSNLRMYLAGGAVLNARTNYNPSFGTGILFLQNIHNVKIYGRGTVHGNGTYWRPNGGWYSMVRIENSDDVSLKGIILRDSAVGNVNLRYSQDVTAHNVKVIVDLANFVNTDGFIFWSSRNVLIDDVLYKGTDDATTQGGTPTGRITNNENINIRNSVFYSGGGFKIGTTLSQPLVHNITYENIDVIKTNEVSGIYAVTGANIENVYFKNIRVEEIDDRVDVSTYASDLFQFRSQVATWEPGSNPSTVGYIRNIFLYNFYVEDFGQRNSVFQGYDAARDVRVKFDNFYYFDQLITNNNAAHFNITNPQYVNIQYSSSTPTIVTIERDKASISEADAGSFYINRSGNLDKPLTVAYAIRGTARNTEDYQTIPASVTFAVGQSSVAIPIIPIQNGTKQHLRTIVLSLRNLPASANYLLGPNFQAMMAIADEGDDTTKLPIVNPRPAHGEVLNNFALLQWDHQPNITQYRIAFKDKPQKTVFRQNFTPGSICDETRCSVDLLGMVWPNGIIEQQRNYAWRVVGVGDNLKATTPWLSFSFADLLPPKITLDTPDHSTTIDGPNINFVWQHDARIDRFILNVRHANGAVMRQKIKAAQCDDGLCFATVDLSTMKRVKGWYTWFVKAKRKHVAGSVKSAASDFRVVIPQPSATTPLRMVGH